MVDIVTVGAGGGSIARLDRGGALAVGPQSAGADPGPACYGKGTLPTVSDANLALGRLRPDAALGGSVMPDLGRAREALASLGEPEEAAAAVVEVANATIARALRRVSLERGYDPAGFTLVAFGGAGPLHACELAAELGIARVLVPRHAGVLSAIGIATAPEVIERGRGLLLTLGADADEPVRATAAELEERAVADLQAAGGTLRELAWAADARYRGQAHELRVACDRPAPNAIAEAFHAAHEREYGFATRERAVELVALRCRAQGAGLPLPDTTAAADVDADAPAPATVTLAGGERGGARAPCRPRRGRDPRRPRRRHAAGRDGLRPPGLARRRRRRREPRGGAGMSANTNDNPNETANAHDDPARLAVWNALLASAAEEMGVTLWRTGHSPNIRERRDFSCAVFDAHGEMVAQAAHIPVHLGAMPESIAAVSTLAPWREGDVAIVNDPYLGGTHLPDVTLAAPVFAAGELIGFVANRAHHADIGGHVGGLHARRHRALPGGRHHPAAEAARGRAAERGALRPHPAQRAHPRRAPRRLRRAAGGAAHGRGPPGSARRALRHR